MAIVAPKHTCARLGNNAKPISIRMLEFSVAASTLKKIDNLILQAGDYNKDYQDMATELVNLRKEFMAEFKKLQ